jgi:hypothetical protein
MTESILEEITIGLGTGAGYASDDLTAAATAARAGEVPILRDGANTSQRVLELRVHGVGGAPATENLEAPACVQVAGDRSAGFYRAWYPGRPVDQATPRREAYCWGKLNYQAATRALWLLLLPFALLNVAHWALPESAAPALRPVGRAVLRLIALTLTIAFVATSAFVLVDVVAWQAAENGALWSWLGWYQRLALGPRMSLALGGVLAIVGGLVWLSVQTSREYERWDAGVGAEDDPAWPLSGRAFWQGERPLVRQRHAHEIAAAAVVVYVAAQPHGSHSALRSALLIASAVLGAVAAAVVASPWTDRIRHAGEAPGTADAVLGVGSAACVVFAAAITLARLWWRPRHDQVAIPFDTTLQVIIVLVEFGLLVVLLVVVAAQRPARQRDVMGKGYNAASLGLLACLIATIFGGAVTLSIANLLGQPTLSKPGTRTAEQHNLFALPTSVYAGGFGFFVVIVTAVCLTVTLLLLRSRLATRLHRGDGPGTVSAGYDGHGSAREEVGGARNSVARSWATAALTDYLPTSLCAVAVPSALALIGYEMFLLHGPGPSLLRITAAFGSLAAVLATGFFVAQLRRALVDSTARRRFGFFWDVVTFWPRACHPLGPPCYAERSIPELVTRIRRIVGGRAFGPDDPALAHQLAELAGDFDPLLRERHSPVLLVGYSQGSPIAVATLAQLPPDVRAHTALLTMAAPVRRLYGRAFPAYFGPDQLHRLERSLTADGAVVRWRNLVRRSDYIGGWALMVPSPGQRIDGAVDAEIRDPPVLWVDTDPTPPPTHTHLVWFADPQTRPAAAYLAGLLR